MEFTKSKKTILAIESSCDETAAAVVVGNGKESAKVLSSVIASQIKIHEEYGGVFPDLAAREHVKKIIPIIELALKEANMWQTNAQASLKNIDAIAVTVGPGLIGSLLVGVNAAAELALLAEKPLIAVNHWAGHLYSVFIDQIPEFPMLALTVSGGHSSLILVKDHFDFTVIGETVDDAAGEAFDKIARMLGLGFPGGPAVSKAAEDARLGKKDNVILDRKQSVSDNVIARRSAQAERRGNPYKNTEIASLASLSRNDKKLKLPRPKLQDPDFDFSFSGLKTAVLYAIQKGEIKLPKDQAIAAREAEEAIVEVLVKKTIKAVKKYQPSSVALVGGVSANKFLRDELSRAIDHLVILESEVKHSGIGDQESQAKRNPKRSGGGTENSKVPLYLSDLAYSTDNAAMIGSAATFQLAKEKSVLTDPTDVLVSASLRL